MSFEKELEKIEKTKKQIESIEKVQKELKEKDKKEKSLFAELDDDQLKNLIDSVVNQSSDKMALMLILVNLQNRLDEKDKRIFWLENRIEETN